MTTTTTTTSPNDDNNNNEQTEQGALPAPPLLITIGPPCSGKTTYLSRFSLRQQQDDPANTTTTTTALVHDIAMDNQRDVYLPLPTRCFLDPPSRSGSSHKDKDGLVVDLDHMQFGESPRDRIVQDNGELQLVVQRCAGALTPHDFGSALTQHLHNNQNNNNTRNANAATTTTTIATTALQAYESVFAERGGAQGLTLPATTDLFQVQALFQPHPDTGVSAIEAAQQELHDAASSLTTPTTVAWGNTNTKPGDYRVALEVAANCRRPVHFVVYNALRDNTTLEGDNDNDNDNGDEATQQQRQRMETDLESVGLEGLLKRNLRRYLETGRYIPVSVVADMLCRTEALLEDVLAQAAAAAPAEVVSRLERDRILARMAGVEMKEDRTVVVLPQQQQQQQQHRPSPRQRAPRRWQGSGPYHSPSQRGYNEQQQPKTAKRPLGAEKRGANKAESKPPPSQQSTAVVPSLPPSETATNQPKTFCFYFIKNIGSDASHHILEQSKKSARKRGAIVLDEFDRSRPPPTHFIVANDLAVDVDLIAEALEFDNRAALQDYVQEHRIVCVRRSWVIARTAKPYHQTPPRPNQLYAQLQ